MININEAINENLDLFIYEDPEKCEVQNLFESIQAPWFYHLMHLLELNKEDFINIKNIIEHVKKRGNENYHILDIIDYKTYSDIMRKINSNVKNTLSVYLFSCKYFLSKYSKNIESSRHIHFVFVFGNNTADLVKIKHTKEKGINMKYTNEKAKMKHTVEREIKIYMHIRGFITWWLEKCEMYNPEEILVFNDDQNLLEVLKCENKYDVCFVDFNDFESNNIYNINNVKSIIDHHMLKEEVKNKRITKSVYPIYVCSCMVIIAYLINGMNSATSDICVYVDANMCTIFVYSLQGIENLLFADYKDYNYEVLEKKIKIRIASIDFSIDLLFSNEDINRLVRKLVSSIKYENDYELCGENNFSFFILLGSYLDNYKLNKDMGMFFYNNDVNKDDLMNALLENKDIKLAKKGCKNITWENNSYDIGIFQINNQSYSRKRLEYFLNEYFS
ncbi:exopolyphosphatase, putative [Plasmodium malariae]|uniref:Exopolyphosphatase, putative n=1 Tax=Plasmodium malariae TaxID=5858 RepID=A0A1A8WAV3_PLAMA|nr:exopolyphosphatase, putative [Plasmodium malariae]